MKTEQEIKEKLNKLLNTSIHDGFRKALEWVLEKTQSSEPARSET